jgi:hypothetical protein
VGRENVGVFSSVVSWQRPNPEDRYINEHGSKGWELVAVYENHFYFKRELFDATVQRQESAHEGRIQLLERIADDIERQNQL